MLHPPIFSGGPDIMALKRRERPVRRRPRPIPRPRLHVQLHPPGPDTPPQLQASSALTSALTSALPSAHDTNGPTPYVINLADRVRLSRFRVAVAMV